MYQVVITGRLLKGAERPKVESELARMFKASPQQVAWLLRGKPIVVKSCEDLAVAQRYESALIRAGLECELRSDQPAAAPVKKASAAKKPAAATAPPQQIPMPGVAAPPPPPPRPPPKPAPARRAPTLGPVTEAITAQDRAPEFVARQPQPVVMPVPPVASAPRPTVMQVGLLMAGAALAGALGYLVMAQFAPRQQAAVESGPAVSGGEPASEAAVPETAASQPEKLEPLPPEKLILGRWECFENNSGRPVQNEFLPDGRYRSLTYGRADAFMQVEQLDVLVEGSYRLEGNRITLHVEHVPSREQFGQSGRVDDYLFWNIQTLTPNVLAWNERRMQANGETCLRSVSVSPLRLNG